MQSCFTGVESTGKITLSKKDRSIVAPSNEDLYLADIQPAKIEDWAKGKRLLVADDKIRLVIENPENAFVQKGDTLKFVGINERRGADGTDKAALVFSINGKNLTYPVDKSVSDAKRELSASDLPMLNDADLIDALRKKIAGKTFWTRTTLWYGEDMEYKKGKKFVPVTVTEVSEGDAFFPVTVKFRDSEGNSGRFLMNIGDKGNESRSFGRLFYLTDPRSLYRHISEDNWLAIQREEIRLGMTKEEVRLSRGNPTEVDAGHDYSITMEIWYYPDGTLVRFVDGLVINR